MVLLLPQGVLQGAGGWRALERRERGSSGVGQVLHSPQAIAQATRQCRRGSEAPQQTASLPSPWPCGLARALARGTGWLADRPWRATAGAAPAAARAAARVPSRSPPRCAGRGRPAAWSGRCRPGCSAEERRSRAQLLRRRARLLGARGPAAWLSARRAHPAGQGPAGLARLPGPGCASRSPEVLLLPPGAAAHSHKEAQAAGHAVPEARPPLLLGLLIHGASLKPWRRPGGPARSGAGLTKSDQKRYWQDATRTSQRFRSNSAVLMQCGKTPCRPERTETGQDLCRGKPGGSAFDAALQAF